LFINCLNGHQGRRNRKGHGDHGMKKCPGKHRFYG